MDFFQVRVSGSVSYAISPGDHSAWDELVQTLYGAEDRIKLEMFIGGMVSTFSHTRNLVVYGPSGSSGKTTTLNIIKKLFETECVDQEKNAFRFISTNTLRGISDLIGPNFIVIQTTGKIVPRIRYQELMSKIDSEIDAIAYHCADVYIHNDLQILAPTSKMEGG